MEKERNITEQMTLEQKTRLLEILFDESSEEEELAVMRKNVYQKIMERIEEEHE